jgi:phage terminase small subunit
LAVENLKRLSPKHHEFINNVLKGMKPIQAMVAAGWSQGTADHNACQMLKQPLIAAEIDRLRGQMRDAIVAETARLYSYTYEDAMLELDDAIRWSKKNKNQSAQVKAIVAKAQLSKLIGEAKEAPAGAGFQLIIGGLTVAAQATQSGPKDVTQPIQTGRQVIESSLPVVELPKGDIFK